MENIGTDCGLMGYSGGFGQDMWHESCGTHSRPGGGHQVTQRGNRQADVIETDTDREAHLRFLDLYTGKCGLLVWAYCVMMNHVHLVAVP